MEVDPDGVPSGVAMRRWTRQRARPRSTASPAELLTEVYSALFSAAVSLTLVLSLARLSGQGLTVGQAPATEAVLPTAWVTVLVVVALLAALAGVMARLGPVSLSPAQVVWWLALPADRRSLLRAAALRWPGLAAVAGGLLGAVVALPLGAGASGIVQLAGAGAGVACAAAAALGLAQAYPAGRRVAQAVCDGVVLAVPALAVLVVAGQAPVPTIPTAMWFGTVTALAGAGVLVGVELVRAERVHDVDLGQRGAVTGEALGALMSLDTRALGRALMDSSRRTTRRRSLRLGRLVTVPGRLRPGAALMSADLLLLLRSPHHVARWPMTALVAVSVLLVPDPHPAAVAAVIAIAAYTTAVACVEGARQAQVNPALDALLPMSQRQVRGWRLVLPTAAMTGWLLVVLGVAAGRLPGGAAVAWSALAVLSGPAWAAAALRGAYRELPDWSAPLVHTPMGAVPPGLSAVVAKGPDVALLGAVPLAVALLTGDVGVGLLWFQVIITAVAVGLAVRPARD